MFAAILEFGQCEAHRLARQFKMVDNSRRRSSKSKFVPFPLALSQEKAGIRSLRCATASDSRKGSAA
jgi:hypothetical protein